MKNLLYKELRLGFHPTMIFFSLYLIYLIIPETPSLVAFFVVLTCISSLFPRAMAAKDMEYTAMLPVRKGDVVKAKVAMVTLIEFYFIVFSIPFAILRNVIYYGDQTAASTFTDLGTNFAFYGIVLANFAIYNLVFFPWYYRHPQKLTAPDLVATFSSIAFLGVSMVFFMVVPNAAALVNSYEGIGLIIQLLIFVGGIGIFAGFTVLAEKLGEKNFAKVDL
jgi:ABC-2 type transport system permease protein